MTDNGNVPRSASLCLLVLAGLLFLVGCGNGAGDLSYARLAGPYYQTRLGASSTLDVLAQMEAPDYKFAPEQIDLQLLTQSDTTVASSGRSADRYKTWVNIVVFDERRMTASRKYFFCSDERSREATKPSPAALLGRNKGLLFDAQLLLDPKIATTPYATEEARRIAILRWAAEQFGADVRGLTNRAEEPTQINELVATAGLMMNQTFQGVMLAMTRSPAVARNLTDTAGVAFNHMSLGEGRIQMLATNEAVALKIRVNLPLTP